MRLLQDFLALPASLLLLLISNTPLSHAEDGDQSTAQWPYNRPAHVKYFPEDPPHRRRDLEDIQEHILAGHTPVSIRKMSGDESEKFFPEYWGFQEHDNQYAMFNNELGGSGVGKSLRKEFEEEDAKLLVNASMSVSFRPAFAVHGKQGNPLSEEGSSAIGAMARRDSWSASAALALLGKRDFQCPAGTSACMNIAAPNLCCATGEVCFSITDTGLGSVGCCPAGASCTGAISCAAGNTPCASNQGGGCCISGYVCAGVGCVPPAVTVISTLTQIVSSSSPSTVIITTIIEPASTSTPTSSTSTSTTSSAAVSSPTDTNTALQTTLSCACGFQACPINLGGGCCPTDRACAIGNTCPTASGTTTRPILSGSCPATTTATTSVIASAPVRPTSASDSNTVTTTSTPVITGGSCPTGFYACSAYYNGGCCRVGRDCQTTDCPTTASVTIVSSGVTIVVPATGAATTTAPGSCASGWYSCAASLGGNCCPSGWNCGTDSCTSTGASATSTEAKGGFAVGGASLGRNCEGLWVVFVSLVFLFWAAL